MFAKIKKWFIEFILVTLAISGCTRSIPVNVSSLETADKPEKAAKSFSLLPENLFGKKDAVEELPGDYVLTIKVKAEEVEEAKVRSYLLHIPPAYDGTTQVPLLVALHGMGMATSDFAAKTGFTGLADANGFIVVYPDAFGVARAWNTGISSGSGANDGAFLAALVDHFVKNYSVNPAAVYFAGYDDGGTMAYKFAAGYPEKLAAAGTVAAAIGYQVAADNQLKLQSPLGPVPVIAILGVQDTTLPYEMTKGLKKGDAGFLPASTALDYWVAANSCNDKPETYFKKNENLQFKVFSCANNSKTTWIAIWNGGHGWPTMDENQIDPATKIWEFFVSTPKPLTVE